MADSDQYIYVDTATQGVHKRNRVMKYSDYQPSSGATDCFMTHLRFTEDLIDYTKINKGKTGKPSVAGYPGPAFAPFLPFDFDDGEDPAHAVAEAEHFIRLWHGWGLSPEMIRIYWSGNKGISIEIPGHLFGGFEPHRDLPIRMKSLARGMTPASQTLDTSIYEKVRLWRLPNTRHGVSGLYKIPLMAHELGDFERIRELAQRPRHIERASPRDPLPVLTDLHNAAIGSIDEVLPGGNIRASRPAAEEVSESNPDLSQLTKKISSLIEHGNRGEYGSRSEADMAVCTAMFSAGYSVEEVWAVMTNPSNGISAKFSDKGRWGDDYLELTISKALGFSSTRYAGRSKVYARRRGEVRLG